MDTLGFESLILFVSDLEESRAFYVGGLGLPVVFEDVVVGGGRRAAWCCAATRERDQKIAAGMGRLFAEARTRSTRERARIQ